MGLNTSLCLFALLVSFGVSFEQFRPPPDWINWSGVLDHHLASSLLPLKEAAAGRTVLTSLDLGRTKQSVRIGDEGLLTSTDSLLVTWDELKEIADKRSGCHAIYEDGSKPFRVSTISKNTGIPASLCPPLQSSGPPTMVLGGFTMHRLVDTNPKDDTAAKINAITSALFPGAKVLDTCCGLGYTACLAAERVGSAGSVTTVEYDQASLEMCCYNPHSKALFDGSLPIRVLQGDACEIIKSFEDNSFNAICHDPPARALTRTDVFSLSFYKQLRRVLKPQGTLFHYIGDVKSKESGRLYKGVIDRLHDAGFANVKRYDAAFGLVASGSTRRMTSVDEEGGREGGVKSKEGLFRRRRSGRERMAATDGEEEEEEPLFL